MPSIHQKRLAQKLSEATTTKNTSTMHTMNLSTARRELTTLLGKKELSRHFKLGYDNSPKMMELLRKYPQLASEEFSIKSRHFHNDLHPFWFAVITACPVQVVKEIYHMYPAALLDHGSFSEPFPFHRACGLGLVQNGPILEFLLQEHPTLMNQTARHLRSPLEQYVMTYHRHVFRKEANFARTVQTMLKHFHPKSKKHFHPKTNDNENDNENHGLQKRCSEVIFRNLLKDESVDEETMLELFGSPVLPSLSYFGLLLPCDVAGGKLSLPHAKAISLILPKLQQLTISVDTDMDAFECILRALATDQTNSTEVDGSLMLPKWTGTEEELRNQEATRLLQQVLAGKGRTLKHLTLKRNLESAKEERNDGWLSVLADSPYQGSLGGFLDLEDFEVGSCESLDKFLGSPSAPQSLRFTGLRIHNSLSTGTTSPRVPCSRMTDLIISLQYPSSPNVVGHLLKLPNKLQNLKQFVFCGAGRFRDVDITGGLCDLLQQSKLQKLLIESFQLNVHALSKVLHSSTIESIRLDGCEFVGTWEPVGSVITNNGKLKEFALFAREEEATWWEALINLLSYSSTLRAIWLRQQHVPITDISLPVKHLLDGSKLTSLKIDGRLEVKIDSLCEELANNTTLKELCIPRGLLGPEEIATLVSLLEHRNFSIENVELWGLQNKKEAQKRLSYLIHLNSHGRQKMVCPETTQGELVDLLRSVSSSEKTLGLEKEVCPRFPKHYILYGLLRTDPGRWCASD